MATLDKLLLAVLVGAACSAATPEPETRLSVGGTYRTAVTLQSSDCPGQTVQQFPTTVTHAPGSSTLTLSHAGSNYPGTVKADGTFTTTPVTQTFDGISYQIGITGRFTLTAIDATVNVAAAKIPPCSFTARWTGPKDGAPNVIP